MLWIDRMGLQEIIDHGQSGYPYEICGVLLGRYKDGNRQVAEVHRAKNINKERANDRYQLDPDDYRRIEEHAQKSGLEVVGVYHSHPDHPSAPSETDRQQAIDIKLWAASWSFVIIEVAKGQAASWRSWVLNAEDQFDEETISVHEE